MVQAANSGQVVSISTDGSPYRASDVDGALYVEILQFYARQMQLLDRALCEEWAQTFTEEGVFAANAQAQPTTGRKALAAAARTMTEDLAGRGIRRRHWIGMSVLMDAAGARYRVHSNAAVFDTTIGGGETGVLLGTMIDQLVRKDGQLLVHHRQVNRDDLP